MLKQKTPICILLSRYKHCSSSHHEFHIWKEAKIQLQKDDNFRKYYYHPIVMNPLNSIFYSMSNRKDITGCCNWDDVSRSSIFYKWGGIKKHETSMIRIDSTRYCYGFILCILNETLDTCNHNSRRWGRPGLLTFNKRKRTKLAISIFISYFS